MSGFARGAVHGCEQFKPATPPKDDFQLRHRGRRHRMEAGGPMECGESLKGTLDLWSGEYSLENGDC